MMLELAMATLHAGLIPAIVFKQLDNFSNFHVANSMSLKHYNMAANIKRSYPPKQSNEMAHSINFAGQIGSYLLDSSIPTPY
jgi:hypothetical protein